MKRLILFVVAAVIALAVPAGATPSSCRPAKFCGGGGSSAPDYCDTGGISGGPTLGDQIADQNPNGLLTGIASHDPGTGGWGPVSGAVYGAGQGAVITEVACAINSINALPVVGNP